MEEAITAEKIKQLLLLDTASQEGGVALNPTIPRGDEVLAPPVFSPKNNRKVMDLLIEAYYLVPLSERAKLFRIFIAEDKRRLGWQDETLLANNPHMAVQVEIRRSRLVG